MWLRIGIGLFLLGHAFVHALWRTYGPQTLFVLFWSRGLVVGAAIDIAILAALLWLRWPGTRVV